MELSSWKIEQLTVRIKVIEGMDSLLDLFSDNDSPRKYLASLYSAHLALHSMMSSRSSTQLSWFFSLIRWGPCMLYHAVKSDDREPLLNEDQNNYRVIRRISAKGSAYLVCFRHLMEENQGRACQDRVTK